MIVGRTGRRIALAAALIFLFLLPLFLDPYYTYVLNMVVVSILLALGLDILTGFTGQISIGHAAFVGIGAYGAALFTAKLGIPFWFSVPLGGLLAALVSLAIGAPSLRLSGHYLALATLVFGLMIQLIMIHWDSLTNGPRGMMVARPTLGPLSFSTDRSYFYIIFPVVILFIIFTRFLIASRVGRALVAVRDSEVAAQSLGVNLARFKLIAFALSSFYAGVAGGFYGPLVKYIDPMSFGLFQSAFYLMMIVVGGIASIPGPIIGAALVTVLPEFLRGFTEYKELIYGLALLLFLVFMPHGIYGVFRNLTQRWATERGVGMSEVMGRDRS